MTRTFDQRLETYCRTLFPHKKDESKSQYRTTEDNVKSNVTLIKIHMGEKIAALFCSVLDEDEEIVFLTGTVNLWEPKSHDNCLGFFFDIYFTQEEDWIVCLTNRNLIAFSQGYFCGLILAKKTRIFSLKNTKVLRFKNEDRCGRRIHCGKIVLQANQTKIKIEGLNTNDETCFNHQQMDRLIQKLNEQLNLQTQAQTNVPPPQPISDNALEQLERLSQLHQQGVLTEQEFQEQKQKILEVH